MYIYLCIYIHTHLGEHSYDEIQEERGLLAQAWYSSFKDGRGYDSWGQPVEAISLYSR